MLVQEQLFLECLKYDKIVTHISDLSPFSEIIVRDNLEFFSYGINELADLITYLNNVLSDANLFKELTSVYLPILNDPEIASKGEFEFTSKDIAIIKEHDFKSHLILYILLRVRINSIASLERGGQDFDTAFQNQAKKLMERINRYIGLLNK